MFSKTPLSVACLAAGLFFVSGSVLADGGYIDTHMHLHPMGLGGVGKKGGFAGFKRRQSGGLGGPRRYLPRGGAGFGGDSDGPLSGPGGNLRVIMAQNLDKAAKSLIARMDSFGVAKTMIMVVPSRKFSGEDDYRNMRDAVRKYPGRLALMAGGATLGPMIQETKPDAVTISVRRAFTAWADQILDEGAKGFGEMISYHLCLSESHSYQIALADHPLYLMLADIAAKRGVPIDLHMEAIEKAQKTPKNLLRACSKNPATIPATTPGLERLLTHNRKANIVWQHVGWDNVGQMTVPLLSRLMRAHPNLHMALRIEERLNQVGGGGPMPNRIIDGNLKIKPEWRAFMEEFQDRLMIGGDEFFSPNESPNKIAKSFDMTWTMLKQLPKKIADKIGRANAARIYKLN